MIVQWFISVILYATWKVLLSWSEASPFRKENGEAGEAKTAQGKSSAAKGTPKWTVSKGGKSEDQGRIWRRNWSYWHLIFLVCCMCHCDVCWPLFCDNALVLVEAARFSVNKVSVALCSTFVSSDTVIELDTDRFHDVRYQAKFLT